jgi:hypothetical protein
MEETSYTKEELEKIIVLQLQNLNAMQEHLDHIKKQNQMLVEINFNLAKKLSKEKSKLSPFPVKKKS